MKNVYLLEVNFCYFFITLLCRHIYSRRDGASIGGANPSKQQPEIRHSVTVCWLTAKILSYSTCSEFDQWSLQKKKKLCSWTWRPRSTSWAAHWPGCCSLSGSWSWFSHSISQGGEGDGDGYGSSPLKCICAHHQILAESAPIKRVIATKLKCVLPVTISQMCPLLKQLCNPQQSPSISPGSQHILQRLFCVNKRHILKYWRPRKSISGQRSSFWCFQQYNKD